MPGILASSDGFKSENESSGLGWKVDKSGREAKWFVEQNLYYMVVVIFNYLYICSRGIMFSMVKKKTNHNPHCFLSQYIVQAVFSEMFPKLRVHKLCKFLLDILSLTLARYSRETIIFLKSQIGLLHIFSLNFRETLCLYPFSYPVNELWWRCFQTNRPICDMWRIRFYVHVKEDPDRLRNKSTICTS